MNMLSYHEALKIVLEKLPSMSSELVEFRASKRRIIKEDIITDRDLPPFDRVMMDGICINFSEYEAGRRQFKIQEMQPAGSPPAILQDASNCIEIMTGAMLSQGTDTVIRYEDIEIKDGIAGIADLNLRQEQNVHLTGTDRRKGDTIIANGTRIGPAEIGVLATVGKNKVKVLSNPKIAVISTGDELVNVDQTPEPHQIRISNSYAIAAGLEQTGCTASVYHLPDSKEKLTYKIRQLIDENDALVLSGAVSKGKLDYLPEVLESLGVNKLFHRVKQRPGKPFWFGRHSSGTTVFALPGNPVSTFACFYAYTVPWILKIMVQPASHEKAKLSEDFSFKPNLTFFLQVDLTQNQDAELIATPVPGKGSGDLANLVDSQAFLILPEEQSSFAKGESYELLRFK